VTRGVLAGAVGAIAMDLLWFVLYKLGGGESTSWSGNSPWAWPTGTAPLVRPGLARLLPATAARHPRGAHQQRHALGLWPDVVGKDLAAHM